MKIGHMPEFTEAEAEFISECADVGKMLGEILNSGSFLTFAPPDKYSFLAFFNDYIIWKQKRGCSKEFLAGLYSRTALCFERRGDVFNSLKYYDLAGNTERVCGILTENAKKHPGNGLFYEMREYYLALPDEITDTSPDLLSAIAMLYSLLGRPRDSEIYYSKLKRLAAEAESEEKRDYAYSKIVYLDIGLPHRGAAGMYDLIMGYASVLQKKRAMFIRR